MLTRKAVKLTYKSSMNDLREVSIDRTQFLLGTSSHEADFRLAKAEDIKPLNCKIQKFGEDNQRIQIRNLKRGNPTYLNGRKVGFWRRLHDGDVIGIGGQPDNPTYIFNVSIQDENVPSVYKSHTYRIRNHIGPGYSLVHELKEVPSDSVNGPKPKKVG